MRFGAYVWVGAGLLDCVAKGVEETTAHRVSFSCGLAGFFWIPNTRVEVAYFDETARPKHTVNFEQKCLIVFNLGNDARQQRHFPGRGI